MFFPPHPFENSTSDYPDAWRASLRIETEAQSGSSSFPSNFPQPFPSYPPFPPLTVQLSWFPSRFYSVTLDNDDAKFLNRHVLLFANHERSNVKFYSEVLRARANNNRFDRIDGKYRKGEKRAILSVSRFLAFKVYGIVVGNLVATLLATWMCVVQFLLKATRCGDKFSD